MNFRGLLQRAAARRNPEILRAGAPPEGESMEEDPVEVQAVRDCIAKVFEAREARALVVGQRDVLVQELNQSVEERTAVQSQITAREKEIALAGGELPDDPFPEEAEVSRLSRHVRIRQERIRVCEGKLQERQKGLDTWIREMEEAWVALGAAIGDRLLNDFREAASALRAAHLGYLSLWGHFLRGWSAATWRHFDKGLAITDPKTAGLLLDPLRAQIPAKWPPSVQSFLKDVDDLRAEVDAVKG
jgi:hypothetical protein